MIYKLTQLLLILSFGLTPVINAMAGPIQPLALHTPVATASDASTTHSASEQNGQASCCQSIPGTACDSASECCGHCFAAMINLSADMTLSSLAPYIDQTQTHSNGVKSEPLTRPPKS